MEATNPSSSSVRVLIRPPLPSSSSTPPSSSAPSLPPPDPPPLSPPPPPPPSSSASSSSSFSNSRSPDGVVVVGFVGRRSDDVSSLINRVLDANVFGSGNLDKSFSIPKEEIRDWFQSRRISYFHEEERGILYLQYSSLQCPAMARAFGSHSDCFDSWLEERDFGDLQGLLFMFSVCHVVIYVQEGSRFDPQLLQRFRILQAAKQALSSYVKSQMPPPLASRPSSAGFSQHSSSVNASNRSPARGGGMFNRNNPSVSVMSGLSSQVSLFPGRCSPVTLFAFLDDFSDSNNPGSSMEDKVDASTSNQLPSSSSRPSLPVKGSGPVVVLARPINKSEGGMRKKLQSSLEAQIRFLIKKCRTLTGPESSHVGPRTAGNPNSPPLFSLDASRAIVLLERFTNQKGESVHFATSLVEDVLNGKLSSDSLLHEGHNQNANREDIQSVKEFIFRQSDILRGRGGLVGSTNSSSVAGVGMVAVAAAVAAASAASKKTFPAPELPRLEIWLSSSQTLLQDLLCAKRGVLEEVDMSKKKFRQRHIPPQIEPITPRVTEPLETTVSLLASGKGLNMKFSTSWCRRALPAAKEVYLKDLPAIYPSSQHGTHLQKALRAFFSMVKGPAVQVFMSKLEDECTSIWTSGRQQCDAVSLTGNPCMHQRHDVEGPGSSVGPAVKPHSSGFVFLHACACGRSRQLRSDPFDFESANVASSHFLDCDKLLPAVQLPRGTSSGPIQTSSWSLIRVGGARYYDPSKGLLQSGFSATQKFLLKWTIFIDKQKSSLGSSDDDDDIFANRSDTCPRVDMVENENPKSSNAYLFHEKQTRIENQTKPVENGKSDNRTISFGSGFPNFTMKKPFSEVVAGSATTKSEFPPLHPRKQPPLDSEKVINLAKAKDKSEGQGHTTANQKPNSSEVIASNLDSSNRNNINTYKGGKPFLKIGSNVVPVDINGAAKIKPSTDLKNVAVYVGFEHECPHGHRFLLTPEHLNDLGSLYSMSEAVSMPSSSCTLEHPVNVSRNADHDQVQQHSSGRNGTGVSRVRNYGKPKEIFESSSNHLEEMMQSPGLGKAQDQTCVLSNIPDFSGDVENHLKSLSLDDGGHAFSLLSRNIPIYMNCPHCKISRGKKDPPKVKFANSTSQLQRIFMVTPPRPVVLATCPAVQFEVSCLPSTIPDRENLLHFSLGCQVILPPESFLTLRLPFVYGVQLGDQSLCPLKPLEHQPELTAWISKGTAMQVVSK